MAYASSIAPELFYPESDGKPMSDNTRQYRWIVTIKENLEILLVGDLDVFIAGDLMWYPVEGSNTICQAPDVMVVFGRPRGDRGSYQQWKENGIGPQIAFEILSPSNTKREMAEKRDFYEKYGIDEYYIYDPDRFRLTGWIRSGDQLIAIANMEGWVSPLLGIRFSQSNGDLEIYSPDGRRFLSSVEMNQQMTQQEQRANELNEKIRSAVANLLGLGLSVEQVAGALSISVQDVMDFTKIPE